MHIMLDQLHIVYMLRMLFTSKEGVNIGRNREIEVCLVRRVSRHIFEGISLSGRVIVNGEIINFCKTILLRAYHVKKYDLCISFISNSIAMTINIQISLIHIKIGNVNV